jgi:hypothetical protein
VAPRGRCGVTRGQPRERAAPAAGSRRRPLCPAAGPSLRRLRRLAFLEVQTISATAHAMRCLDLPSPRWRCLLLFAAWRWPVARCIFGLTLPRTLEFSARRRAFGIRPPRCRHAAIRTLMGHLASSKRHMQEEESERRRAPQGEKKASRRRRCSQPGRLRDRACRCCLLASGPTHAGTGPDKRLEAACAGETMIWSRASSVAAVHALRRQVSYDTQPFTIYPSDIEHGKPLVPQPERRRSAEEMRCADQKREKQIHGLEQRRRHPRTVYGKAHSMPASSVNSRCLTTARCERQRVQAGQCRQQTHCLPR